MTNDVKFEKAIKEIMKDCNCSREDAIEVYEIEQNIKENKGTTKRTYEKSDKESKPRKPRERKPNTDKQEIIQTLDDALCDLVDNVVISNIERSIDFEYNNVQYSITLTAHRPPKV